MQRIHPTVRQLVHATIVGLRSHPRIINPGIYDPYTPIGQEPRELLIEHWRTYDGYELQNPGLTCSVFPDYTNRKLKGGVVSTSKNKSIIYKPHTLGRHTDAQSNSEAIYRLIVALYYKGVAINELRTVRYDRVDSPFPHLTNHAYQVALIDQDAVPNNFNSPVQDTMDPRYDRIVHESFDIEINPPEEVLRDYMDLIRLALNDLPTLMPFATVRSPEVVEVDFPTTSWTQESANVYFHMAYLTWELTLYPPNSWRDIYFMKPNVINTDLVQG